MSNLKQIAKKITASIPKIEVLTANAEVVATTTAQGDIIRRIFNEGKRTDGASIGTYTSPPYKKRRELKKHQTKYVDLQMTGDLFNSIGIGQFYGNAAVGIKSDKENDIANHNETRYGEIFTASAEEKAIAQQVGRDYMFNALKNIIKGWS